MVVVTGETVRRQCYPKRDLFVVQCSAINARAAETSHPINRLRRVCEASSLETSKVVLPQPVSEMESRAASGAACTTQVRMGTKQDTSRTTWLLVDGTCAYVTPQ